MFTDPRLVVTPATVTCRSCQPAVAVTSRSVDLIVPDDSHSVTWLARPEPLGPLIDVESSFVDSRIGVRASDKPLMVTDVVRDPEMEPVVAGTAGVITAGTAGETTAGTAGVIVKAGTPGIFGDMTAGVHPTHGMQTLGVIVVAGREGVAGDITAGIAGVMVVAGIAGVTVRAGTPGMSVADSLKGRLSE